MAIYTAGVDIGGTKCLGVVLDDEGNVVAESRVSTPVGDDAIVQVVADVTKELSELSGGLDAVGVGVPGLVTPTGLLRFAPNLVGVVEFPVLDRMREAVDVRLVVDNDANCAAWAEHLCGAAVGAEEAVLVTLGTGIGTGVIVNGKVQRGAHGFAGELGHVVVEPGGELCPCGRRGCWETLASAQGLTRLALRAIDAGQGQAILALAGGGSDNLRGEHVTRAARSGDEEAKGILSEFARYVALGLTNFAAVMDPELILIGGGLVAEMDLLLEPISEEFERQVFARGHRPPTRIEPAGLGERAGAMGAALLARSDTGSG